MNSLIEATNLWAEHAARFAWPMLWQSSLMIGLLFTLDLLLRGRVRPAVRYALWLIVLVKLVLPPSLALPTGAGWWLRPAKASTPTLRRANVVVSYGANEPAALPTVASPALTVPPPPRLSAMGWGFVATNVVSLGLLVLMLERWLRVARDTRRAVEAPAWLIELLPELRRPPRLRLTDQPQSPAVCGLFRPVVLLPRTLATLLPPEQLRAVLWHELIHLRRGDVWVNCAQALLQVVYWWHPLLWLANARIRRLREEAVDDAVMLALKEDADAYAPTLLEVAKLALPRPLASLGLVGILESRSSLSHRIERLLNFRPPRKAGLGLASALGVFGFAALAVPMGEAPAPAADTKIAAPQVVTNAPVAEPSSSAALVPDQKIKARELVQDGKLLYEMGKLDEAKAKLSQVIQQDPQNQVAQYYLQLVGEAQPRQPASRTLEPAPSLRTNNVISSSARQRLWNKLKGIRLDSVSFDGLPLREVARVLGDEARKHDPDRTGINLLIAPAETSEAAGRGKVDPWTGMSDPTAPAGTADLGSVPVTIKPALINVRMGEVLNAVLKGAGRPIKYSIEDYAVVFSAKKASEPPPLHVRNFKVNPNTPLDALRTMPGLLGTNGPSAIVAALRELFAKAGVDLDPARNPGKAIFYDDRRGWLLVRASPSDLDTIEQLITELNNAPPQINLQFKVLEVPQEGTQAMGFDWDMGNVQTNNGSTSRQANAAPPANGVPTPANPPGVFPGSPAAGTTGALGTGTLTGILTEPQFRIVRRTLEQRGGAELLAANVITTSSGRQVQCKATDTHTVVSGINQQTLTPPGLTTTNDDSAVYLSKPMEFGIVLDSCPTVLEDGFTINMPVIANLTEFLGYGVDPTNHVRVYVNGQQKWVTPPRPIVRRHQMSSTVNVTDGQTIVLGGLEPEPSTPMKDPVPMLGDLPLLGRLFRSESKTAKKRNLLIFITPTIVDPAGNRVHPEGDSGQDSR